MEPLGASGVTEPHSLPAGEHREATAEELAQGVKDIVAAFPSIHHHVAEMTLKVGAPFVTSSSDCTRCCALRACAHQHFANLQGVSRCTSAAFCRSALHSPVKGTGVSLPQPIDSAHCDTLISC